MEYIKMMFMFFVWFKYPLIILCVLFSYYFVAVFVWLFVYSRQGKFIQKGDTRRIKKRGIFVRLFYDFPKQYALDLVTRPADFFKHQGLIIYEGRQGSGKTSTMVRDTKLIQYEYPKCKVITNLAVKGETDVLSHWRQLVNYTNGIYGVVAVIDEMQNWFSSNQSKNFPPEMLSVITQNRKNRRVIFGTAQSFHLLAKSIRSQCIEVRKCVTFFGCITFVLRREPILDSEGNVAEWKKRGTYFYVHDKELRESYDTWKVIDSLTKSGFQDTNTPDIYNYTNVLVSNKKAR